jgi:ribonuclease T1
MASWRHPIAFVVSAWLALTVLAATHEAAARTAAPLEVVAVAALPPEARATLEHIHRGGPFPYSRDGVVFGNREHILPAQARGYYHEYTVPTPGVRTRGARRIVCGGDVTSVSECYYSDDHYQTFRRIRP